MKNPKKVFRQLSHTCVYCELRYWDSQTVYTDTADTVGLDTAYADSLIYRRFGLWRGGHRSASAKGLIIAIVHRDHGCR